MAGEVDDALKVTHHRSDLSWLPVPPVVAPNMRTEAEPHSAAEPVEWIATRSFGASGDPDLEAAVHAQLNALFELFVERQRKYGPENIAMHGDRGVCVRCDDKMARLRRHYKNGVGDMPDESVDDAWRDLAVYAVIALVCRKGQWPGAVAPQQVGR